MSNIRELLSCNQDLGANPFTDDDIQWVEGILGLSNGFDEHQLLVLQRLDDLDVEACPGSGKTTVLVAKLALLARYWNSKTQGICVLSMTNAAREEIQDRLGETEEGQKLLSRPHFIGTIHSFFSEFLAKPYLNSKGIAIVNIDDDFCRSQRLRTLQKDNYSEVADYLVAKQVENKTRIVRTKGEHTQEYQKAAAWLVEHEAKSLEERRYGIPSSWKITDESYNLVSVNFGKESSLDLPEPMENLLKECIKEVAHKGVFCFSDLFVYSKALMKYSGDVFPILRKRFPLLFIDEAQDTSSSQALMLHELFSSNIDDIEPVTRQRFGDANQTIYTFEPPMSADGIDPYPSTQIGRLTLPVSHRFDMSVSEIACNFETHPLNPKMQGVRQDDKGGRGHCILVFNEDSRMAVIPAFAKLVTEEIEELDFDLAKLRICSHIQKEKDTAVSEGDYARTIRDYFPPYIADKMTKDYQQHKNLISYLRHARYLVRETQCLSTGLEKVSEGILKGCYLLSADGEETKGTRFAKIKSAPNKYRAIVRELNEKCAKDFASKIVGTLVTNEGITKAEWATITSIVTDIIQSLLGSKEIDSSFEFLEWEGEGDITQSSDIGGADRTNIYRHELLPSRKVLNFKLGTVHSVKGQTHTATLLLDCTNRGPILGQLKPFFLGSKLTSEATSQQKSWLNTLYVGLTRPTHLVCVAIPESHKGVRNNTVTWNEEELAALKSKGWKVARVKECSSLEYI
ncbi:UvrD-helicase domain-containing protein [Aliivibrio fischeri]|uniref:UvrD-helicase domain-containing protein n=1 Tax=Aliivibrio fischeri TaxID=668 RepID=UPI0007C4A045|nr:UvrD-helicase domain-containing protein [Aliivibrio fischeri]MBP3142056.1 ATP-dependent helicase [Aliivibrio fischeri]MBP3157314.1 ATP-dependent helicase [Aliivibrio fischeri]MCE7573839.1 UvrD-helicase domain-containing protein [Aliivibrio fischeri]